MTSDPRTRVASAPGKLVLLGEFAVLYGAPALVLAVDRRAVVRFEPVSAAPCRLDAPGIGLVGHRFCFSENRIQHGSPIDAGMRQKLAVIVNALEAAAAYVASRGGCVAHFVITTDTRDLATKNGVKLGFGSSAAVATATFAGFAASCLATAIDNQAVMHHALRAHRSAQGGGSGIDIAAAALGGALTYRIDDKGEPAAAAVSLPASLCLLAVWTGAAQSTPMVLAQLARFRDSDPVAHSDLIERLAEVSSTGIAAVRRGDAAAFMQAVCSYGDALVALGTASRVEIVSETHKRIAALVIDNGAAYKPSGAGGDLGLVVCADAAAEQRVKEVITSAGFGVLPVVAASAGVTVAVDVSAMSRS